MFVCQCLEQRAFHDPPQLVEGSHVGCQAIVIGQSSIFKLIGEDDGVIALTEQLCSMDGLSFPHIGATFRLEYVSGDTKSDASVDTSAILSRFGGTSLGIIV